MWLAARSGMLLVGAMLAGCGEKDYVGDVYLGLTKRSALTWAAASFGHWKGPTPPLQSAGSCQTSTPVGDCVASIGCVVGDPAYQPWPESEPGSAGVITVRGGGHEVILRPQGASYPTQSTGQELFRCGDAVTIHAGGGDVPPFDCALRQPGVIHLDGPDALAVPIDRASDLSLSWPCGGGRLGVTLEPPGTHERFNQVTCAVDGQAGHLTIPSAALQVLPAGPSWIVAATEESVEVHAGRSTITCRSGAQVLSASSVDLFALDDPATVTLR